MGQKIRHRLIPIRKFFEMKPEDFNNDETHEAYKLEPPLLADLDRIEKICLQFNADAKSAETRLRSSLILIDGSKCVEILPGVIMVVHGDGQFRGVNICVHCMRLAALHLRDLAGVCDDLIIEAEKNGTKLEQQK